MATKPTRQQERACDKLAEALLLIAEAARLNGPGPFDRVEMGEVARRLARASTAFDLDAIVARRSKRGAGHWVSARARPNCSR